MTKTLLLLKLFTISESEGLPYGLLESVCTVESNLDSHIIRYNDGGEDSLGLCQVKLSTAEHMKFKYTREDLLKDPVKNMQVAARFIKYQYNRYSGSYLKAIKAYNRGHAKDTRFNNYSRKVFVEWSKHEKSD